MKKMIRSIRENSQLIITNIIILTLTFTETMLAITGHTTIAGIVAITAFVGAMILFFIAPYGEETIAAITTMFNAFAFGIGMFYSPERTWIAYIAIVLAIFGFVFEVILTDNRRIGRL